MSITVGCLCLIAVSIASKIVNKTGEGIAWTSFSCRRSNGWSFIFAVWRCWDHGINIYSMFVAVAGALFVW